MSIHEGGKKMKAISSKFADYNLYVMIYKLYTND